MQMFEMMKPDSGIEFEKQVARFLIDQCGLKAYRTGKNDHGIDIVAEVEVENTVHKFYIQCKFQNTTVSKRPIQEVFAGCHYYGADGTPVVFTNQRVTMEARSYAKKLGVEIIGYAEAQELLLCRNSGKVINQDRIGLTGIIAGALTNHPEHIKKSIAASKQDNQNTNKYEQEKAKIINNFEKAEEYLKEASILQQKALEYSQQALMLQKEAIIRNLDYG